MKFTKDLCDNFPIASINKAFIIIIIIIFIIIPRLFVCVGGE